MSYAEENPNRGIPTVLVLGVLGVGAYLYYRKKEQEEMERAFHALEERVELEDFNPLTLLTKVGGLMGGEVKIISFKRMLQDGSIEDDLGEEHAYKAKSSWLVEAQIDGADVLLLVRRNGTVELLEG